MPEPAANPEHAHAALADYDTVALALQGGGALGSYQAGVYQALDEAGIRPNHLAGISIGALNAAIIAGNAPEQRVEKLHEFWDSICRRPAGAGWFDQMPVPPVWRESLGQWSALRTLAAGQPGFFRPRLFPPVGAAPDVPPDKASWYDTAPLRDTLHKLVDFERLNDADAMRVQVSAVNVRSGNFTCFDNRHQQLRAEHFMASGALPPGLPPVAIDGEYYWDGGVVSNTPLYQVMRERSGCDKLVFQVDLWSAHGALPHDLTDVAERMKEIQYSSRTRFFTEFMRERQEQRRLLHDLMQLVPEEQRDNPTWRRAEAREETTLANIIHLIYHDKATASHFRDYEFSTTSMHGHWASGRDDMRHTLAHPEWLAPPDPEHPFVTHDVHREHDG